MKETSLQKKLHRMHFTSLSKLFWKASCSLSAPGGILPVGTLFEMVDLNRFPGHREMKGQGCINKQLERTPHHPNVLDPHPAGAMCVISLPAESLSYFRSLFSFNYHIKNKQFKMTEIKVFTVDYYLILCSNIQFIFSSSICLLSSLSWLHLQLFNSDTIQNAWKQCEVYFVYGYSILVKKCLWLGGYGQ